MVRQVDSDRRNRTCRRRKMGKARKEKKMRLYHLRMDFLDHE